MLRRAWLVGITVMGLPSPLVGDEPVPKLQIVVPRPDGIMAVGINGRGDTVGFEWVENSKTPGVVEQVAFFARGKTLTRLPLLKGYTAIHPAAVSDDGVVVGRASKAAPPGVLIPLRNQAFVWDAGQGIRGLGTLVGDNASFATDITLDGRRISGFSVGQNRLRACLWERAGDSWKGTPLPYHANLGSNLVVLSDDGKHAAAVDGEKPCLWTEKSDGSWVQEFIGESGSFVPRGVNNSGLVVGVRYTPKALTHAVTWQREGGVTLIEKPPGYVRSEAFAVNNHGLVVGMVDGPAGSDVGPNAFVYDHGRFRLIDEGGPYFSSAAAINDHNQVTGVADKEDDDDDKPDHAKHPAKATSKP